MSPFFLKANKVQRASIATNNAYSTRLNTLCCKYAEVIHIMTKHELVSITNYYDQLGFYTTGVSYTFYHFVVCLFILNDGCN